MIRFTSHSVASNIIKNKWLLVTNKSLFFYQQSGYYNPQFLFLQNHFINNRSLGIQVNYTIAIGGAGNLFSKYVAGSFNGFLVHVLENYGSLGPATVPWYIRDQNNRVLGDYGETTFLQPNMNF